MNIGLWIIQILVAAAYLMAGFIKTTQPIARLSKQMEWAGQVPVALVRFIGVAELLGAIGLVLPMLTGVVPSLTIFAALGLVLIQILAAAYHLGKGEVRVVPINIVLLVLAAAIAYGRVALAPA